MRRLALLSPLPPSQTGIADYTADLLAILADRYTIDVFHDQDEVDLPRLPSGVSCYPVQELEPRFLEAPYDLAVYQMGNGRAHAFLYAPLARFPGLLVLHDLVLHHSRAETFLDSPEARAYARDPSSAVLRRAALGPLKGYEEELAHSYGDKGSLLAEAHLGTIGSLLPYAYPLFRGPVEASRLTLVHNAFMARAIQEEVPQATVALAPMPMERIEVEPAEVAALRRHLAIEPEDFVVGCLGLLTKEKQIEKVARAVARAQGAVPRIRFLLVGGVPDESALTKTLDRVGIRSRTVLAGRVPFETLAAHIEACDVVAHLRYPTARESSAALLRVLAQGRPTVISDLENLSEIPDDATLRADPTDEEGALTRALMRLAHEPELRRRLQERSAAFVAKDHAPEKTRQAYEGAISRALEIPDKATLRS